MTAGLSEPVVYALTFIAGLGVVSALPSVLIRSAPLRLSSARGLIIPLVVILLLTALANSMLANIWLLVWVILLYTSVRRKIPLQLGTRRGWGMIWLVVGLTAVIVGKNFLATYNGLQARHAFPSVGALSTLIAAGWFALLPQCLRRYLPHGVLVVMLAANLVLLLGTVMPLYFQPVCSQYSSATSDGLIVGDEAVDQDASRQAYRWWRPPTRGNPTTFQYEKQMRGGSPANNGPPQIFPFDPEIINDSR
jgi:hypothetical protein